MKGSMFLMTKLWVLAFGTISAFFFNIGFAASDSTSVSPPSSPSEYRFATAYVKINVVSQNSYSSCVSAGTPPNTGHGIWADFYTLCPSNSFQSVVPSIDSTQVRNCVCSNVCTAGMARYGNLGLQVSGINCTVPVTLWLPNSLFVTGSIGQNIVLFGTLVYATNFGTQIIIQPSASVSVFDVSVRDSTMLSPYLSFLSNFITIGMFQLQTISFPGCTGSTGC